MVGIVSYGAYVPRYRIKPEEIGRIWGTDGASMGKGLMINQKSVPSPDEDTVTISTEAARYMLDRVPDVDPADIGAVYIGSESHPYAVKPSSTIVAEAIGATPNMTAADLEFACKAGTAGIQAGLGLVKAGMVKYAVAIGADTSQGAPGDALEYSAAAGGAAYLLGTEKVIAEVNKTLSFTTDTPDFWRREGMMYPVHGGRFSGEPAYFRHVTSAAKMLGFTPEQLECGLLTPNIGNTYSGAVPLGLAHVLDHAKAGDRILVTSYGSGAGSDAFDITVTDEIDSYRRDNAPVLDKILADPVYVDYATYAKYKNTIKMPEE